MARFIKVADTEGSCDFIDLDQVAKISCGVARKKSGGGFNIASVGNPDIPAKTPASESVTAVIALFTAGGMGEMHFTDLDKAASWAQENLGIAVPFNQL